MTTVSGWRSRSGGGGAGGGAAAGRKLAQVRFPSMIGPMSPRKPTGGKPGRTRGPERALLLVRLDPEQAVALRAEARRRQGEAPQIDVSAVVREAVDLWLKRRRK